MTLHLFTARRSCHDVGVCQRTGPQCRRACHMPTPAAEPPIGYEAARPSNVRQLRAEHDANLRAEMLARGMPLSDEEKDRPAGPWARISSGLNIVLGIGLLFALLALLYLGTANPSLLWHDLQQAYALTFDFLRAIYWGAIHTAG